MFKLVSMATFVVAALLSASLTGQARAQWVFEFERPFVSNVTEHDLNRLIELFEPEPDMELLLRQVYDDHVQAFRAFVAEAKPIYDRRGSIGDVEEADEDDPVEIDFAWRSILVHETLLPLAERQRALDRQTIESFAALLVEQDEALWETFERERRLRRADGMMSPPTRLNLVSVIDDLELDEQQRADLDDLLEAYMLERDEAVRQYVPRAIKWMNERSQRSRARAIVQAEAQAAVDAARERGVDDPMQIIEIANEFHVPFHHRERIETWQVHEPKRRLRRINRVYADSIAGALADVSEEIAMEFRDQIRRLFYPDAFLEHPARSYIHTILALELDDDMRLLIEAEAASYAQQDAALTERVIRAFDDWYSQRDRRPSRTDTRLIDSEARRTDALNARADLSDRTVQTLFMLLSEPQREAAPKPPPALRERHQ